MLEGKTLAIKIKEDIKTSCLRLKLVVIQIGNDEASKVYIKSKEKACLEVGIDFLHLNFDSISEEDLVFEIKKLNDDNSVTGILLQLPIPKHFNVQKVIDTIAPNKDVDGLTSFNVGKLWNNASSIIPCTPKGIMELINYYNISLEGKNAVIIGRSNLVSKPLINLFLEKNATVSICHSKTKNIEYYTKNADIIVVAVGKAGFLTKDMIKDNVTIIDVGINRVDHKIVGDVASNCLEKTTSITPVPGGVGLMTVAMLLKNIVECSGKNNKTNLM